MRRYKLGSAVLFVFGSLVLLMNVSLAGWGAMSTQAELPPPVLTEPQKRMVKKFGPDVGYELRVDAMKGEEFEGVNFYEVGVAWPFYGKGGQTLQNRALMGKSGPIPEQVRIIWRDSAEHGQEAKDGTSYNGKIIGQEIIEVGSRIPQAVANDLKRNLSGGLTLKFRMSNQGTLVGWDVVRFPDYKPNNRDQYGSLMYGKPVYSGVGGDFREAEIYNGEVVRKGWYIDKKTGQKIETDF